MGNEQSIDLHRAHVYTTDLLRLRQFDIIGIFTDTPYHKNDISGVIVKCNSLCCLVIPSKKTMDKKYSFVPCFILSFTIRIIKIKTA